MIHQKTKRLTRASLLLALTLALSYLEHLLPGLPFLPPGVRLGLSNIPVMYALFFLGPLQALVLSFLKGGFVLLTRGFTAGCLSLCGGLLSVLVMALLSKIKKPSLSYTALSMAGGVSHNLGQLLGVYVLISRQVQYYLPLLVLFGLLMGFLTGTLLRYVLPALSRILPKEVPGKGSMLLAGVLSVCLLLCSSCSTGAKNDSRSVSWYDLFDTYSTFTVYGEDEETFNRVSEGLYKILKQFHQETDIYHQIEGMNSLYSVNQQAGSPVQVSQELFDFLVFAKESYSLSEGSVNVMLGTVTGLWKQAIGQQKLPAEHDLEEALAHTDIKGLLLEESTLTVTLQDPKSRIDVGALAKGYAGRLAGSYLQQEGVDNYLLSLGGSILASGSPKGTGRDQFLIGIQDPDGPEGSFRQTFPLTAASCATSGDYERYFELDGVRYHHLIDPKTGYPAAYHRSATVLCDDPALADLLSTAVFCMETKDGQDLAASLNASVIYIDD